MSKNKLMLIGASGHGNVVADIAVKTGLYTDIAFLDDMQEKSSTDFPVLGKTSDVKKYIDEYDFFVSIGNSKIREGFLESLIQMGASVVALIHPDAVLGSNVKIGYGTAVMAGAVINTKSTIGNGVIINTCSSVDHDNIIGDYSHIAVGAHLAGNVHIDKHTWVGAGATVINNIDICSDCMIGAGAVVVNDICESGTYIGVPAKKKE